MKNELPAHYSLLHEKPDHFMIHDARVDKAFPVAKKGIHPATQMKMLRLPKYCGGGKIPGMDEGGVRGQDQNWSDQPGAEDDPQFPKMLKNLPIQPPQQDGPMSQMDQTQADTPPSQQVQAQPAPQPQGASQNGGVDFGGAPKGYPTLGSLNNAVGQEASGINQQAQGQVEQNKQMADVQQQHLALEQESMRKYQETMQRYQAQNDQLMQAVTNQKINPDQYWDNHSKFGAAIATVLSGIGQGLSHQTNNMAMDVIQSGINRSIESQKAELGKKENLLSNNLKVQGNLMQAETATRLQMNAMLQGKLALVASKTGDPMILGQAQQKIGQLKQAAIPQQMSLAQYQTQMHMRDQLSKMDTSKMDPAQLVNYLPNVTPEAKTQILKEIDAAQNVHINASFMADAQERAANNMHVADFVPGRNNADQDQLHTLLGPTFKDLGESVRPAAMENVFHGVTPRMGDAVLSNKDTLRNTLKDYLSSKQAAPTAKSYGLDLSKFESTRFPEEAFGKKGPREGMTGIDRKTGQRVMMRNGQVVPIGR